MGNKINREKEYSNMVRERFVPRVDPNISICLENLQANMHKSQYELSKIKEKMEENKDLGYHYLEYAKSMKKTDHESAPNIPRIASATRDKSDSKEKTYVYGDGLGNKTKSVAHYPNYIRDYKAVEKPSPVARIKILEQ